MGKANKQTGFINHRRLNVSILYRWYNRRHSSSLEIIGSACEFGVREKWGEEVVGGVSAASVALYVGGSEKRKSESQTFRDSSN